MTRRFLPVNGVFPCRSLTSEAPMDPVPMRRGAPLRFAMAEAALGVALCALLILGSTPAAFAAAPEEITYQAVLQDDNGDPVNGTVDLTFRIYSAPSGGSALWSESHTGVVVDAGVFHVNLGSVTPLTAPLFASGEQWLETAVNGTSLAPRRQFLSTPYALHAAVAEVALAGGGADNDWTIDGDDVYRMTGNVGIGTDTPARALHVRTGDLGIDGADLSVNTDLVIESADAGLDLLSNSAGTTGSVLSLSEISGGARVNNWSMSRKTTGSGAKLQFAFTDAGTILNLNPDSRVGIGTDDPQEELHIVEDTDVDAGILLEKVGGSTLALTAYNSTVGIGSLSADDVRIIANNSVKMHVGQDGNVGIGTISPTTRLEVNGGVDADQLRVDNSLGDTATPDVGGVYADNVIYAWGQINGAGTIERGYGIASVSRLGVGWYRINYKRTLSGAAIPIAIPYSANDVVNIRVSSSSTTYCELRTSLWIPGNHDYSPVDYRFIFQVTGRP